MNKADLHKHLLFNLNPTFSNVVRRVKNATSTSTTPEGDPSSTEELMAAQVHGYGTKSGLAKAVTNVLNQRPEMKWCERFMYSGYEGSSPCLHSLAHGSPPGVSVKPFNLDNIAGKGCSPVRETRVWRAYEHILDSWPPPHLRPAATAASGTPLEEFLGVDWAVGSFQSKPRSAGASSRSTSFVLDGITTFTAMPDAMELERELDMSTAAKFPWSEVARAREEITQFGFSTYPDTQIVG